MVLVCVYPTFTLCAESDIRSIFKRSIAGLNSKFSFSSTEYLKKTKELVSPTICPRALERSETLASSFMIWTHVTESISDDDNHYATYWLKHGILIWLYSSVKNQRWGTFSFQNATVNFIVL